MFYYMAVDLPANAEYPRDNLISSLWRPEPVHHPHCLDLGLERMIAKVSDRSIGMES
jgi:hypothetical protein